MSYMKRYMEDNLHICWDCDKTFTELLDFMAHREANHNE